MKSEGVAVTTDISDRILIMRILQSPRMADDGNVEKTWREYNVRDACLTALINTATISGMTQGLTGHLRIHLVVLSLLGSGTRYNSFGPQNRG